MQISRHWRLNAQRYRLEGVVYETGETSLLERTLPVQTRDEAVEPRLVTETPSMETTVSAA